MKKRILLMLVMTVMLVLALAVAVSAESVHAGKVDLNQKVILNDGTECALFDAEGNALIWFRDNTGALKSIRADIGITGEDKVDYVITAWNGSGGIQGLDAQQIDDVYITVDGVTYDDKSIVVFNIMDDDVVVTTSQKGDFLIGKPVNCMQNLFNNKGNILEYLFLRLDTVAVQAGAFQNSSKLKYANLEDLYTLRQIAGNAFNGCTSLFEGEVVDLSNTQLVNFNGDGVFNGVPLVGIIYPNTVKNLGNWALQGTRLVSFTVPTGVTSIGGSLFNDCKSLKTIYINNTLTKISDRAFNNTALEKIFYVGSLDQLNTLLGKTGTNNNTPFWNVVGEDNANVISYADYQKLEDKSGMYVVYNYSYCEAYNNGNHTLDPEKSNPCAGICSVCGDKSYSANPSHDFTTTIAYTDYCSFGIKTQTCSHEGCQYAEGTPYVTDAPAIITSFQGISTKINGDGLTIDYIVNYEALEAYSTLNGVDVELGFVVSAYDKTGDKPLDNESAVKAPVLTWKYESDNSDVVKYTGLSFRLEGNWDQSVDLDGNGEKETSMKDIKFCMAGYIIDNGAISYINANGTGDTADFNSYNGVTSLE